MRQNLIQSWDRLIAWLISRAFDGHRQQLHERPPKMKTKTHQNIDRGSDYSDFLADEGIRPDLAERRHRKT
jgi:hypothetical protein